MRKITCMLLLIQSGFMMAQTRTVVTQNGEKVAISTGAKNGLTATNGYIQLGGALTQPSVLTTTSAYTLAIQGLQAGAASDNVLVSDANGVLKFVPRSSFTGADNLGNHTATTDLTMSGKNIHNAANVTATGTVAAANVTASTKATVQTAQITKGTDGVAPKAGYVAMANDTNGNLVWRALAEVSGTSSVQFYIQSTGKSAIGSTSWSSVPGFTNVSYVAPQDGDLILQSVLYSALDKNPTAGTPAMTNTQMKIVVNGTDTAFGMSTPIGIAGAGKNPACTVMFTKFAVKKGTTYLITVQAQDVWNSNAGGTQGAYVGTFTYSTYSTPSTMMATLITK